MATRSRSSRRSAAGSAGNAITFVLRGAIDDGTAAGAGTGTGTPITRGAAGAALPAGLPRGRVLHSLRLPALRGGGGSGGGELRVQAVAGRDVVVLQLAGGPALVLHPANAQDLLRAQHSGPTRSTAVGAGGAEVDVPAALGWAGLTRADDDSAEASGAGAPRGAARGLLGDALLAGFQIVSGAAGDTLADGAAARLAARVDAQVDAGVYALDARALGPIKGSGNPALPAIAAGVGAAGPLLVLVHGTFSHTASAFGKLWAQHPQRVAALFEHYGGRVYALEHATLLASPVANALALAQALPTGARLHLLTHSRGGLVAEVLARVAANPTLAGEDLRAFDAAERQRLAELGRVLARKRVRVERIVRVACPARGTLLASKRLDAYLSVFKWTLELAAVPVLPALVELLAAVAQRRADPDTLPGLAAQVPDSALIQWLHAAAEPLPGELRVIAGDVQADSVGSWLKTLVADGFYWTDNDFVVQTRSMYGGAPRSGGALFLLDRGGQVAHSQYFGHERTAAASCSALMHDRPEGFGLIGPLSWQGESASGERGRALRSAPPASDKPALILLPGIAGSHLAADGRRVWLSLRLVGGLRRLAWPDPAGSVVQPDGVVGSIYDELVDHLSATHEVIEFAYDWRRPIEDEARRLAGVAEAALAARAQSQQPLRFVAHSMGGLVVRTLALQAPALWRNLIAQPGARVLMLGTPNAGSWAPMQLLSGDDTFGNTLTAFGAPFQDHAARQLIAQMPGLLQLQAGLTDPALGLARQGTWEALAQADLAAVNEVNWWHHEAIQLAAYRWGVPPQSVLDAALALRLALDKQRDEELPDHADKWLLVVGRARTTPDGFVLGAQGLDYLNVRDSGDGRVTRASALLPGVRSWVVDCEHGALASHQPAFAAYAELLASGSSSAAVLEPLDEAPATHRAAAAADAAAAGGHVSAPRLRSRPSRSPRTLHPPQLPADLGRLPAADAAPGHAGTRVQALAVTVVNGNLMFIRQPLLIGHYRSTLLTGSEAAVDGLIGGGMQTALQAGLYPDEPGTHQLFRNNGHSDNPLQLPRPEWAIVVGLGDESELKPAGLLRSVRQAIVAWSQRVVEQPGGAASTFELAATLLGSGGTGISPGQSAQLIAQAAREANQSLAQCGWPLVGQLHLVELYLDRAAEAWRALQVQAAASPSHWRIADRVSPGVGALRQPLDAGYRGADYDLISAQVREGRDGEATIVYTLDTKRARTELRAQATQARLVRELVARASSDRQRDPQIGRSLYQLLIPVEMDPFLGGTTEMRLKLDAGSAGIPWELLQDDCSAGGDQRPWAVRTKLMRTLITTQFRQQVCDAGADDSALVIGEPATPADEGWPRLAGARAEAQAVAASLAASAAPGRVKAMIAGDDGSTGPDAREVINALLERDWQVVHIAGHGAPPERRADGSDGAPRGVVLSHGYLGPNEVRAMRTVPELVFVNCCFLAERNPGQLLEDPARDLVMFASTVAEALINVGVRCVIAAGWAVEDGPAETFATHFYRALTRGSRFIDAAALAREQAWAANRASNTWAAYQCYGDPNWTLRRSGASAAPTAPADRYAGVASPPALALALETVAVDARFIRGRDDAERERRRQSLRQRLTYLEGRFAATWGGIGAVAEAYAVAYSELGDAPQAIGWYERALAANDASATQKAIEQLANLRVRQATTLALAASAAAKPRARAAARRAVSEAVATFERLLQLGRTIERHSLAGSAYKRLAMIEGDAGREAAAQAAIARMRTHCAAAEQLAWASAAADAFYPALNRIAADLALAVGRATVQPLDAAAVARLRSALADKTRDDPDFWSVAGLTELRVYEAVAAGNLAAQLASLNADYAELQRRVAAPRDWRSVHDTARFVLERYAARTDRAAEKAACEQLVARLSQYAWPIPGTPAPVLTPRNTTAARRRG